MTNGSDIAFPEIITELEANGLQNTYSYGGLTKREYFAAMAMQGLLANSVEFENHKVNGGYILFEPIAIRAAQAADALLIELNKSPQT